MKIIVFDIDETLGFFKEFGLLWHGLNKITSKYLNFNYNKDHFVEIMDFYPEFLRPDIVNILKYINNKIKSGKCDKIMIYTNNQAPPPWIEYILYYFETKINGLIFDKVIKAFKINSVRVEFKRTTHKKTLSDFINCTNIPSDVEICFIDDTYYASMVSDNVVYIQVKPYFHSLPIPTLINRLCLYKEFNQLPNMNHYCKILEQFFTEYKYKHEDKALEEQEIDQIGSMKMMSHIKNFLDATNNNSLTKKKGNKSYKSKQPIKSTKINRKK